MSDEDLKSTIRRAYGKIALGDASGCCGDAGGCCGGASAIDTARAIGYTDDELAQVPEGANLGLGSGNPVALASLGLGERVLDLGSGGGFDCFLAAARVGPEGHVIGVDMTPEMLALARHNAAASTLANVEFRLGELEALPVADAVVDVVISNCVINLVPDRTRVFREAYRVLKPGGRLMISDTLQTAVLPEALLAKEAAKAACLSPAVTMESCLAELAASGFAGAAVVEETAYPAELGFEDALAEALSREQSVPAEVIRVAARSMVSIGVTATKPRS